MLKWNDFYNHRKVGGLLIVVLPKVQRYKYLGHKIPIGDFFYENNYNKKIYLEMLQSGIVLANRLQKEKILKFILKPTSMNIQLTYL
jgi:hypothetical protein